MNHKVRQGDVFLVPVDMPANLGNMVISKGILTIAEGEVTGHHHTVETRATGKSLEFKDCTVGGERFVFIPEEAECWHPDHNATVPTPIKSGWYKVTIENEVASDDDTEDSLKETRRVRD